MSQIYPLHLDMAGLFRRPQGRQGVGEEEDQQCQEGTHGDICPYGQGKASVLRPKRGETAPKTLAELQILDARVLVYTSDAPHETGLGSGAELGVEGGPEALLIALQEHHPVATEDLDAEDHRARVLGPKSINVDLILPSGEVEVDLGAQNGAQKAPRGDGN